MFAIATAPAVYNERIAIVLGLVTLVLALAAFLSCRTFVSLITRLHIPDPSKNRGYKAFNRYHMYYWWFFGVAVVAHVMMGVFHTGLPQAGDPDAGAHWVILSLGLTSFISGTSLFLSCRISPRLLSPKISNVSFKNKAYLSFFGYHSFYWIVFAALVAAHFATAYAHAGIWPK